MNKVSIFLCIFFVAISIALSALVVKGDFRNNKILYQVERVHTESGPFETSTSTGRFALTEAIVRNNSLFLTTDLAKFSRPDVVKFNGKFISIFPPGVSILGVPLYILGDKYGVPQIGAYSTTILFSIINLILIARIVVKMGASVGSGLMAGGIFLFATNSLVYAMTFMQHQYSTTIILLGVLNAFGERTVWKNFWFGFIFGVGILIDIPNALLMVPITVYLIWSHIDMKKIFSEYKISIRYNVFAMLIGLFPTLFLFGIYNEYTTGSYINLGQAIGQYRGSYDGEPVVENINSSNSEIDSSTEQNNRVNFLRLKTRRLLDGLKILLIGDERSWFYYSPVLWLSLFVFTFRKDIGQERKNILYLIFSVILVNILLYGMFGDPWGGWAFGARYLIPSAALVSIYLGLVLQFKKTNWWFMALFAVLLAYSIHVNVLGAITTTGLPPRVEAEAFEKPVPHTYAFNAQYIKNNRTSSLFYNIYLKNKITVWEFWNYYTATAFSLIMIPYLLYISVTLTGRFSHKIKKP